MPKVYFGQNPTTPIGTQNDFAIVLPKNLIQQLSTSIDLPKVIKAPLAKNQTIGNINIKLDNQTIMSIPAVALSDNPSGGFFTKLSDHLALWF